MISGYILKSFNRLRKRPKTQVQLFEETVVLEEESLNCATIFEEASRVVNHVIRLGNFYPVPNRINATIPVFVLKMQMESTPFLCFFFI